MLVVACIKQVPDTTQVQIDPVTNTLIREGVESVINPFDAYAIEFGVVVKSDAKSADRAAIESAEKYRRVQGALRTAGLIMTACWLHCPLMPITSGWVGFP